VIVHNGFGAQTLATRSAGVAFVIGMHAVIGAALVSYEPARSALLNAAPIMINLISPAKPDAKPVETPPQLKPVVKAQPEPLAMIAAPVEAPSPSPILAAPPSPEPVAAAPEPATTAPIFAADYLDNPPPGYPPLSRRVGEQGRVLLRVLVNPGGRADDVEVRSSSGHFRLDEAARQTVRGWRFVPAKRGDQPVPAWVLIPISFRLEG
jgi:protein TonB